MPTDPVIVAAIWAFIGASFGGLITIFVAQRALRAQHVISERRKWREKIRALAIKCTNSEPLGEEFWLELAVNSNPYKEFDAQLVLIAYNNRAQSIDESDRKRLVVGLARLLKHDWERAKIESSLLSWCASERAQGKCSEDCLRLKWPKDTPSTTIAPPQPHTAAAPG